jgi:hypothetical protein
MFGLTHRIKICNRGSTQNFELADENEFLDYESFLAKDLKSTERAVAHT